MQASRPITIVGGGLAGLTLGIGLRQRDVPVVILEAGHYPRHRVCGEFISGRGQEVLQSLGLMPLLHEAAATFAQTARFFSSGLASSSRPLPQPAICLSRFKLDALLAEHFRQLGGELHQGSRWQPTADLQGMVNAAGRRAKPLQNGWRWFGLKVHANNVALQADLEMHLEPHGYVGLCRLNDEKVNVCALFRRHAGPSETNWKEMLLGMPGSPLRQRFVNAVIDDNSFCGVSGLSLTPIHAHNSEECSIGDALTMIPPITGNGMSMAFEAAELAIEPLTEYSHGQITWAQAQQAIARQCDTAFAPRLAWAAMFHRLIFGCSLNRSVQKLALQSGWLWNLIFKKTR